ncbi:hypothetical protein [Neobacillus sedimentimangrovi]|uniref:hypothetical protein n=1 Tax=Neobacillus sedimentimangrovi TaxID=2699460 RepID=UPI0004F5A2E3|nr:hypothetical protein [Neobacillus sedimentimangrovi]AIM16263.1 hypothetical protein HW35_08175 [Bacillus sp. X1(2014)]
MKRKHVPLKGVFIGIILVILVFLLVRCVFDTSEQEALEVVDEFYRYEQKGDFAQSWQLFHSSMKQRFSKGHYIQDRAHVFMNHFGVETFTYTIGEPEKLEEWKISKDQPALTNVYKFLVTQTYKGKYGNFDIQQEVFVVQEKEKWKIMWDYNH